MLCLIAYVMHIFFILHSDIALIFHILCKFKFEFDEIEMKMRFEI